MKQTILYYIIFLLCCMLCLFTACDTEQLVPDVVPTEQEPAPTAVSFNVDPFSTKGSIEKADSIVSLGVFGYSTGTIPFDYTNPLHLPNLIYNQEAWRAPVAAGETNNNPWQYNPVAYWPIDASIQNTFFAYSPHSSKFPPEADFTFSAQTDTGYPKITYTVPNRVTKQVDVLYATPVLGKNKNDNGGMVNYQMKHALTWLVFVVAPEQRVDMGETVDTFQIKSLRFIVDELVTRAELNLGTGVWKPLETSPADYEFDVDTERRIPANTMAIITPPSSRLMMIPQNFTQVANPSAIDVVFTVSGDGNESDDDEEYFYSVPFPDTKLGAGGVTIYLLRLSADGVKVEFYNSNYIDPWLAGEEQVLEVY